MKTLGSDMGGIGKIDITQVGTAIGDIDESGVFQLGHKRKVQTFDGGNGDAMVGEMCIAAQGEFQQTGPTREHNPESHRSDSITSRQIQIG